MKLKGFDAIEFAEQEGLTLNKKADHIDPARHGLTIAEAEAIAVDDPDLIWLELTDEEYGQRRSIEPGGGEPVESQEPGTQSHSGDIHAAGTPAGGTPVGGLAGTNIGHGSPENADIEEAMFEDQPRDVEEGGPPYSGHAGGAVGGTPAQGRADGGRTHGGISPDPSHRGDSTIGSE